jgi:DNA repair photolyase
LDALRRDAARMVGDPRSVLLCFTCDPYQPLERDHRLTRRALAILGEFRLRPLVLTKAGMLAREDVSLFAAVGAEVGVTLLFDDERSRAMWEPNAAPIDERVDLLRACRAAGVRTWVSVEPVIAPDQALRVIERLTSEALVDRVKVGRWNHDARARAIDWPSFVEQTSRLLEAWGGSYYLKDELWASATHEQRKRLAKERWAVA